MSSTSDICCAVDKTIEVPQEWVAEVKTVGSVSGFVEAIVDLFVANSEGVREATKQMAGEIALPHLNLLINQVKRYAINMYPFYHSVADPYSRWTLLAVSWNIPGPMDISTVVKPSTALLRRAWELSVS